MIKADELNGVGVLAADIGGTKTLVALVRGAEVLESRHLPTARGSKPSQWLKAIYQLALEWDGRFDCLGVSVTGQVQNGVWQSINTNILSVGEAFDLGSALAKLGRHHEILNDAQAAAWAEHLYGAGKGSDLVYLTISTGLGGGVVANGKLLRGHRGLAGHFGQVCQELVSSGTRPAPFEDIATGRWMAGEAKKIGLDATAKDIFTSAESGDGWSREIIATSAARVARLCRDIQFTIDPPLIVIGGGIGAADGYVSQVRRAYSQINPNHEARIVASLCQGHAGILGIAAIAAESYLQLGGQNEKN